ncbi:MAG: aminoacyl-tRNA hydrolase [Lachnospiraceae bacterium]|nr:aminoacyl-tRNA hydrolase [Lachnospiraceae bacterium]
MYIIAGLGNPGREYENTRHNTGFMVIDEAAEKYNINVTEKKHKALIGKGIIGGQKVILVKPQTFMNLSGESIREVIDYYKIDEKAELIVISDDISLEAGAIRIRKRGSAGGHNGLKNIILHLGHDEFQRIRMGVGEKPQEYELIDYVLGRFDEQDSKLIAASVKEAAEAIEVMITDGPDAAMNNYNKRKSIPIPRT